MSIGKVNHTQKCHHLQSGVILQKCVILPLTRFELPSSKVMLHLRGVKLQLGLKPLHRNLTHSVYRVALGDYRKNNERQNGVRRYIDRYV